MRGLKLTLNTGLRIKNKIQAFGSQAVPVSRYIFGIINWSQENI
jgi:hypothetical protein